MERLSRLALTCAIAGLVCNILMVSYWGVPVSIGFGIFGIALAVAGREPGEKMCKRAKTAVWLSLVAIIFGLLIYWAVSFTIQAMADPDTSKMVMEIISAMKDQMPTQMQEMLEAHGM